jgi:hypothetical protein
LANKPARPDYRNGDGNGKLGNQPELLIGWQHWFEKRNLLLSVNF